MSENCFNMALMPGTTLQGGMYVIQEVLGRGSFGITYKATDLSEGGLVVAIKELFVEAYNTRNEGENYVGLHGINHNKYGYFVDRFEKEARSLKSLDSDKIVRVYDFFRENGTAYMVMSYVQGTTIRQEVENHGPMKLDEAVKYITQVCDATAYIHSRGILHRDIAPDNIVITSKNGKDSIVLIDFGSARTFIEGQSQQHTVNIKAGYTSPEQTKETAKRGASSDIYSLGAVLYYMMTGESPMPVELRRDAGLLDFPTGSSVPEWIKKIINKAMQMDSKARYQSVEEMNDDITKGDDEYDNKADEESDNDEMERVDEDIVIKAELAVGTKLQDGKYVINGVLGIGGFGITYIATNKKFEGKCAIKEFFLRGHNVRHSNRVYLQGLETKQFEDSKRRFREEAKMLYHLKHPNIVKVEDFFTENGTEYMVMEFVEGETLQSKIEKNGPMPERQAMSYICQILDALDYIHHEKNEDGKGLLHRDISPDNIIITSERGNCDRAVLIDFGNARRFVENRTQRQTVIVKHGYAPMEQYSDRSKKGAFSDLYSLGAVFYYLLTGIIPADSKERESEPGSFEEPIKLNPNISKSVNAIIVKAMEMKPDRRYQTATEMRNDIMSGSVPVRIRKKDAGKWLVYIAVIVGVISVIFAAYVLIDSAITRKNHELNFETVIGEDVADTSSAVDEATSTQVSQEKGKTKKTTEKGSTSTTDKDEVGKTSGGNDGENVTGEDHSEAEENKEAEEIMGMVTSQQNENGN